MEQKKKRAPNYNIKEKEVLLHLVAKHKNIIENKKTDAVSVSDKNQAWFRITDEFNTLCPNNIFRPTGSLKKFYENLKEDLRKRAGEEKRAIYKTGGGPPSPKQKPDDDILLGIINKKSIFGLENPFDNDNLDTPKQVVGSDDEKNSTEIDSCVSMGNNMDVCLPSPSVIVVDSHDQCQNEQGEISNRIEMVFSNPSSSCGQMEDQQSKDTNWSKTKPDHLRRPLSLPLKQNIMTVNKNKSCAKYEAAKFGKTNTRRRPTTVRVLSSSALAEKYSVLIERKLELAECLKKEHHMRMKVLNFDLEMRKKGLKTAGYTDMDIQLLDSCEINL